MAKINDIQFIIPVSGQDILEDLEKWEREFWEQPSEYRKKLKKKAKDRRYYKKHKDECNAKSLEYNRSHPEQRRETNRRYYVNNREKELKRQATYLKNNQEKYDAHKKVSNAVRSGELVRTACEVCGDAKAEAHHEDYSKPLDVIWLCHKCHMMHHSKKGLETV